MPAPVSARVRLSLTGLLEAAGVVVAGATLAGFAGCLSWALDLFAHFRPHYAAFFLAGGAVAWWVRRPVAASLCGLGAVLNMAVVGPVTWTAPFALNSGAPQVRLLACNVKTDNSDVAGLLREVRLGEPDVVILMEVDDGWIRGLESLREKYPHQLVEARSDNFGLALFSRWPLHESQVHRFDDAVPSLSARIEVAGRWATVLATHPVPPMGLRGSARRNQQLEALAEWSAAQPGRLIVAGDLNLTPWSPWFTELTTRGGLTDVASTVGWLNSWPTFLPAPVGIAIDHCLVRGSVRAVSRERGERIGSDHFPVRIRLQLD